MPAFGPTELTIILIIVILLFGVGRIGKIFGELGQGLKAFRNGLADIQKAGKKEEQKNK
ncbi:MAG: twin-arginine translocase TatA/TatE family subunit [Anaerolineales bacterium]|jgi:sec-independent protein translocase protein TatA